MAKSANQIFNDQDSLLTVGPFMGLDTTTAPFYVAPNNAVAQQNVAINRQYGVYSTAQGRIANVMSSAIAQPVIGVGVTSYITTVSTLYYYPGLYVLVGTVGGSVTAYYAGVGSIPAVITNWAVTNHVANFSVNLYESKFVFAQSYVFVDCPIVKPQMIVGTQISFGTNAINWGIVGPTGTVGTAATGSGALNGYYSYAVTFVNTSFTPPLESSPNAFPALVYAVGQNIAISAFLYLQTHRLRRATFTALVVPLAVLLYWFTLSLITRPHLTQIRWPTAVS